ncbi:MAG: [Clostridia bacterium]|nr:[citrate (pro-3S)-lyase] ligase [Clostridia bacterium]
VLPTGPYLISSATFPTYFVKDRDKAKHVACDVDIEIFKKHFAKRLGIKHRFVGTEPYSPMTDTYNGRLEALLPPEINVTVIRRFEICGAAVSASEVRKYIKSGNREAVAALVPKSTLEYLDEKKLIKS